MYHGLCLNGPNKGKQVTSERALVQMARRSKFARLEVLPEGQDVAHVEPYSRTTYDYQFLTCGDRHLGFWITAGSDFLAVLQETFADWQQCQLHHV